MAAQDCGQGLKGAVTNGIFCSRRLAVGNEGSEVTSLGTGGAGHSNSSATLKITHHALGNPSRRFLSAEDQLENWAVRFSSVARTASI